MSKIPIIHGTLYCNGCGGKLPVIPFPTNEKELKLVCDVANKTFAGCNFNPGEFVERLGSWKWETLKEELADQMRVNREFNHN